MSFAHRVLYPVLDASWGAALGDAARLAFQAGAWAGRPSNALVLAGGLAVFGAAYSR